jgi:hypothetical protein
VVRKALFAFIGLIVLIAVYRTTSTYQNQPATPATPAVDAPMSRGEFMSKCVVGRQAEVCLSDLRMRPDSTQGGTSSREYWYFRNRTFDPITNKRDSSAQVVIENGVVRGANFN